MWLLFGAAEVAHAQARQAQLPWWDRTPERTIGPYWIKTDVVPELANSIARHLNFMHGEYRKRLGDVPVRVQDKLNVLVFADRDEWAFTVKTHYAVNPPPADAPNAGGGFFAGPGEPVLAMCVAGLSQRQIEQLIQREGFRQFASNRFGDDLPLWLTEGLADLFGEAVTLGDSLLFGQSTPEMLDEVKQALDTRLYVPLDIMLDITAHEWNTAMKEFSPTLPHRQARLMALFAMQRDQPPAAGERKARPGRSASPVKSSAFERLMRHLNNGLPAAHAFARSFGGEGSTFENDWQQFVKQSTPGSLITALDRIEFLAEGALALSRRKVYPQSLDELKSALREIDFKWQRPTMHGVVELSAMNDALYEIPKDALCVNQPLFVISKSRLPTSRKEQVLENDNPTPPVIATQNLRPIGVQVRWVRDVEKNTFTYQVVVR